MPGFNDGIDSADTHGLRIDIIQIIDDHLLIRYGDIQTKKIASKQIVDFLFHRNRKKLVGEAMQTQLAEFLSKVFLRKRMA